MKRAWLIVVLGLVALQQGCVTRRYLITSDPPGAIVYRDGQPIGPTPVEEPFLFYGTYRFRLVKDGYQPLDVEPELETPWYQYPGIDFVTENLIPYPFRDVKVLHFHLQPLEAIRPDEVRARAENLRSRGTSIQTPPGTDPAPRIQPRTTPAPTPPTSFPPPTPARDNSVTNRPSPSEGASPSRSRGSSPPPP
jgi:hypothetical protein